MEVGDLGYSACLNTSWGLGIFLKLFLEDFRMISYFRKCLKDRMRILKTSGKDLGKIIGRHVVRTAFSRHLKNTATTALASLSPTLYRKTSEWYKRTLWWRNGSMLDLQSRSCGFNSRSSRCQVTTTQMGDCSQTGKPSQCITKTSLPFLQGR